MSEPVAAEGGDAAESGDAGAERTGPVGERRWPMATGVLAAVALQIFLPHRGRVTGWWLFPVFEVVMLGVLIVRDPGRIDRRSENLRRLTILLIAVMTIGNTIGVIRLAFDILGTRQGITATTLLGRGAAVWVTNVIVFSLWYWEFDRGGPAERAARAPVQPSFSFAEDGLPERVAAGWAPAYPDYLYLAFTNATAFSPTDVLPVSTWAKMTLMLQAAVSLVTAILVVARAINILPG